MVTDPVPCSSSPRLRPKVVLCGGGSATAGPGCPSPAAGFMASVITDTLLQTPSQNGMSAADSESRPEKWCTVTQALTAHVEQVEATKNFLFSADREALTNRRHCSRPRGLEVNRDIRIVPAEAAMLALVRG